MKRTKKHIYNKEARGPGPAVSLCFGKHFFYSTCNLEKRGRECHDVECEHRRCQCPNFSIVQISSTEGLERRLERAWPRNSRPRVLCSSSQIHRPFLLFLCCGQRRPASGLCKVLGRGQQKALGSAGAEPQEGGIDAAPVVAGPAAHAANSSLQPQQRPVPQRPRRSIPRQTPRSKSRSSGAGRRRRWRREDQFFGDQG